MKYKVTLNGRTYEVEVCGTVSVNLYDTDTVAVTEVTAYSDLSFNGLFCLVGTGIAHVQAGCLYIIIHGSSSIPRSLLPGTDVFPFVTFNPTDFGNESTFNYGSSFFVQLA